MNESKNIWKTTKQTANHFGISESYLRTLKDHFLPQFVVIDGQKVPTWRDLSFQEYSHLYRWNIIAIGYFFDSHRKVEQ